MGLEVYSIYLRKIKADTAFFLCVFLLLPVLLDKLQKYVIIPTQEREEMVDFPIGEVLI